MVFFISSILEFSRPGNEEFVCHPETVPTKDYFVLEMVVFFAVLRILPDTESLPLVAVQTYLNGACNMNVDWS